MGTKEKLAFISLISLIVVLFGAIGMKNFRNWENEKETRAVCESQCYPMKLVEVVNDNCACLNIGE